MRGDDASSTTGTVCHVRGDREFALLADAHVEETLVPTLRNRVRCERSAGRHDAREPVVTYLDDLASTEGKVKGRIAVERRVELGAVEEETTV